MGSLTPVQQRNREARRGRKMTKAGRPVWKKKVEQERKDVENTG